MNKLLIALALAASLAGCAQIASGINAVNGALTSPAANQAVANLKSGSQAILCAVANTAAVAGALEQAVNSGQAIVKDTREGRLRRQRRALPVARRLGRLDRHPSRGA